MPPQNEHTWSCLSDRLEAHSNAPPSDRLLDAAPVFPFHRSWLLLSRPLKVRSVAMPNRGPALEKHKVVKALGEGQVKPCIPRQKARSVDSASGIEIGRASCRERVCK